MRSHSGWHSFTCCACGTPVLLKFPPHPGTRNCHLKSREEASVMQHGEQPRRAIGARDARADSGGHTRRSDRESRRRSLTRHVAEPSGSNTHPNIEKSTKRIIFLAPVARLIRPLPPPSSEGGSAPCPPSLTAVTHFDVSIRWG